MTGDLIKQSPTEATRQEFNTLVMSKTTIATEESRIYDGISDRNRS